MYGTFYFLGKTKQLNIKVNYEVVVGKDVECVFVLFFKRLAANL